MLDASLLCSNTPRALRGASFQHIKDARSRRAKECAQELELVAAKYPELARHIQRSIKAVRRESMRTPQSDNARVLSALEKGDADLEELARRARLPRSTVYKILHRPQLLALISISNEYLHPEPGRGGYRRARKIYGLRHSSLQF